MKGKTSKRRKGKTTTREDRSYRENVRDQRGADRRESERAGSRNDISWYTRNPNLLVAAGSFPFPYRPGMVVPLGPEYSVSALIPAATKRFQRNVQVPGVMVLEWMPAIGQSATATDPASILGKEFYARVRQVYSGSLDADAPDFVMYVFAMDSIFSYIAWLKRVYRLLSAWSPENYVTPDVLLKAMGFSEGEINSLRVNKMALWQAINELVLQSRKFTVPASMDVFNRHYWMSDNVYTDDASINSQFYMFNLHAVYRYKSTAMPGTSDLASGLEMVGMPTINRTMDGTLAKPIDVQMLYNFGRNLIDTLVAWDDAYTINGYLRRAFEGDAQFIVDELPQMQPFNPVYEPEVLAQIENSRALPNGNLMTDLSGFAVSQNVATNAVISNPSYTVALSSTNNVGELEGQGYLINPVLSVRSMNPTVADSVIASRLQACVDVTVKDGNATVSISCGTEVPICWRQQLGLNNVASNNAWQNGYVPQTPCVAFDMTTTTQANLTSFVSSLGNWLRVEQYDWHPFVYLTTYVYQKSGSVDASSGTLAVIGDTHNITTISKDDLKNLHKVCIYSEFNSFGLV